MSQFAEPGTATGIEWSSLNGSLLVIEPTEVVKDIATSFGPTDAVRATVSVVDGAKAGSVFADTLVFPKVLKSQLASRVGQKVLGRLGQGQAKPGQSPPWLLNAATPEDGKKASEFLAGQLTAADII